MISFELWQYDQDEPVSMHLYYEDRLNGEDESIVILADSSLHYQVYNDETDEFDLVPIDNLYKFLRDMFEKEAAKRV